MADDVARYTKTCMLVFYILLVMTIVTVTVAYFDLPVLHAVALGLAIAIIKGSLVAVFFMHLSEKKKAIYWTLALTAVFFFVLLLLPLFTMLGSFGEPSVYGP